MRSAELAGARWVKSSYSTPDRDCVEVAVLAGAPWFKSSYSNPDRECVEVAFLPRTSVAVRDSKQDDTGAALLFAPASWRAFVGSVPPG